MITRTDANRQGPSSTPEPVRANAEVAKARAGQFRGFDVPHWTPVPDDLFDEHLPDLSGAELKVLLYVIRRTYGFKKQQDAISISQMLHGIVRHDGRVLDRGTGLSKKTLLGAIKSLCNGGYILRERRRSRTHGDEATLYKLHVREPQEGVAQNSPTASGESATRGGGDGKRASEHNAPAHESFEKKTVFVQDTDKSKDSSVRAESWNETEVHIAIETTGKAWRPDEQLGNGYTKEEDLIAQYIDDFSRDLGDGEHVRSNVTQAINIYRRCQVLFTNVDIQFYIDVLQASRDLVRKVPNITKTRANGTANRMPYFFSIVRDYFEIPPGRTLP